MENPGVGESTSADMAIGLVEDAPLEVGSVLQSQVHDVPQATTISSSDHSAHNYEERENKRTRPWRDTWSNYNHHGFGRTYHRDNSVEGYNGQAQNRYNEGRRDQRWTRGGHIHNMYPQPMTYHRDNAKNPTQSYGYHVHRYHDWNVHSTGQHYGKRHREGERNCANWESRSGYDRQQPWTNDRHGQPWTNDRHGQPWTNDRHRQPWTNDRHRQPWTNDRHRQPWTNDRHRQPWTYNISHRGSPDGRGGCSLQIGDRRRRFSEREGSDLNPPQTSYGSHDRQYRNPIREESRTYYRKGRATSSDMVPTKNDQVEKTWARWPVPCEGNQSLKQIDLNGKKFEPDAKQEIGRDFVHEQTIVRVLGVCSRKKLLILDVNGLLADVIFPPPKLDKADINICRRAIFKRPFLDDFLKFCFEMFDVAIWSSRTKKILDSVVDYLLGDMRRKLLFCWDQSHCTKTGFRTLENKHKELLLKEMKKVWEKHEADLPWEKGYFDESNTLLLDDSPYKALRNPMHTAIFPHTYSYKNESDNSLGVEGDLRAYLTGLATAENVKRYVEEHPFGQCPIDETSSSWAFYLEVITGQATVQPQVITSPALEEASPPSGESPESEGRLSPRV